MSGKANRPRNYENLLVLHLALFSCLTVFDGMAIAFLPPALVREMHLQMWRVAAQFLGQ